MNLTIDLSALIEVLCFLGMLVGIWYKMDKRISKLELLYEQIIVLIKTMNDGRNAKNS